MTGIRKVGISSLPQLTKFSFSKTFSWWGQGSEMVRGSGDSPLWLLALVGHTSSVAALLMLLNSESFLVHGH